MAEGMGSGGRSDSWSPRDIRVILIVTAAWTGIALLSASTTAAVRARSGGDARILESFGEAAVACGILALLTPIALRAGQRFPVSRPASRFLGLHILLAMAYWIAFALTLSAVTRAYVAIPADLGSILASSAFGCVLAYTITVAAAQFVDTKIRLRDEERARASLSVDLARAQLHTLTGQLRPHFLFNALNAVATLIQRDPPAGERLVLDLARLLRSSLERTSEHEVALAEEMQFLHAYVSVMSARIGDRLTVGWRVPEELATARVPQLVVLPLVENALQHGIMSDETSGHVVISAMRAGDRLVLTVTDDGPGPPVQLVDGIGLGTTRSRLGAHYGSAFELTLRPQYPRGTEAVLALPLRLA